MARLEEVLAALRTIRAPLERGEYDLHALVAAALDRAGLASRHEVPLAPRCRIDFLCGGIGIEVKRGQPERARIRQQLARYAACDQVEALVLVTERAVDLPPALAGKPLRAVCLRKLWGIAL